MVACGHFFEHRDLGIELATDGQVAAHVIRAVPGGPYVGKLHLHPANFKLVYVLKG